MNHWAILRRGGYHEYKVQYIQKIPITRNKSEKLENHVKKILSLNEKLSKYNEDSPENQELTKQIKSIDNEIDELVYKLYNITEEEKKIIESSL